MIDIHTHILPNIDDGSKDLKTSLRQLELMRKNGTMKVVCSPHFLRNTFHNTADKIDKKFKKLQNAVNKENIDIKLVKGVELYLDDKALETIQSERFCIENTDYILVETSMTQFPADLYEILYQLVKAGYKPIMAHPERYGSIINDNDLAEDLMYKNVYLQMNAGSLFGQYGKKVKKTAWNLLEKGYVHFLASDNHCNNNEYNLQKAYEIIAEYIDEFTAKLLTKVNPEKMLKNEIIDYFYLDSMEIEYKNIFHKFISKIKKIL